MKSDKISIKLDKLKAAVDEARNDMAPFIEKRKSAIEQYVGENYGHNDKNVQRIPMNMLELAVSTYTHRLVSHTPKVDVTTEYNKLRPSADSLRLALDYLISKIDLDTTLKLAVKDSLFGMGIVKVGINDCRELIRGFTHEGGQPFAGVVSLEDFVYDTSAKSWEQCQFFGNRLFLDEEAAKRSGCYQNIDKLGTAYSNRLPEGISSVNEISTGRPKDVSTYRGRYSVWEFWLPFENIVVTTDDSISVVLRQEKWSGPSCGPYHFLSFNPVPDNIMPLPPVALWRDLHEVANRIWRKVINQAERQKSILPFDGKSREDAERIQNAGDGDVVRVDNPQVMKEVNFGGPRSETLGIAMQLDPIFSRYAGNLDTAAGLSPMSKTASQESIINMNCNTRFEQMSYEVGRFVKGIVRSFAYWLWTDDYINLPLVKRPVDLVELKTEFSARTRHGEFLDYNFEIVPYSMTPKTPQEKVQHIMEILASVYQPYAQLFAESGIQLDVNELLKIISEASGIPELNRVLAYGNSREPVSPDDIQVGKPPTHSVYERINRPGASYGQQMGATARAMMGIGTQPAEMTMGRTVE